MSEEVTRTRPAACAVGTVARTTSTHGLRGWAGDCVEFDSGIGGGGADIGPGTVADATMMPWVTVCTGLKSVSGFFNGSKGGKVLERDGSFDACIGHMVELVIVILVIVHIDRMALLSWREL